MRYSILRLVRGGAGPNTKLLIGDMLLPYACDAEDSVSFAPKGSPLLPNLGYGSLNGYVLDVTMLGMMNGKESMFTEMDTMMRAAGWRIVRVKRAVGSLWSYITAEPM